MLQCSPDYSTLSFSAPPNAGTAYEILLFNKLQFGPAHDEWLLKLKKLAFCEDTELGVSWPNDIRLDLTPHLTT